MGSSSCSSWNSEIWIFGIFTKFEHPILSSWENKIETGAQQIHQFAWKSHGKTGKLYLQLTKHFLSLEASTFLHPSD